MTTPFLTSPEGDALRELRERFRNTSIPYAHAWAHLAAIYGERTDRIIQTLIEEDCLAVDAHTEYDHRDRPQVEKRLAVTARGHHIKCLDVSL